MAGLELYARRGCLYCAKVTRTLDRLGLDYEVHTVPFRRGKRREVFEVSGQYGVPVLVDREHGIEGMPESDDIVTHLETTYGDGEPAPTLIERLTEQFS